MFYWHTGIITASRIHLLLGGAATAAFGLSLAGSFHWDDYALFTRVPALAWWTRPLTYATFWLNGSASPLAYHAVNLGLHLCAVALLFAALQRLVPGRAAWVGAAVFAIHPMQAEAVNYVFARATLLATVLCLMALLAWLDEKYVAAVALFGVALLAKEECAAFPVFLLLLEYSRGTLRRGARLAAPVAAMLALAAGFGLWVIYVSAHVAGSGAGAQSAVPWTTYALSQGVVIWRYLRLFVLPWGFSVDPAIATPAVWLGLCAWAALAAAVLFAWRRGGAGFWFAAAVVLLLPSSSIFPASDLAADRRMYLPMIALAAWAGVLAARVPVRALAAAGVLLMALSVQRTMVWRTERSLWADAAAHAPQKVRPLLQLARAEGPARAEALLDRAARLAPDDAAVYEERGRYYLRAGDAVRALPEFGRALALKPGDAGALNNRGVALLALRQAEPARQDFLRALERDPCLEDARENLAAAGGSVAAAPVCGR